MRSIRMVLLTFVVTGLSGCMWHLFGKCDTCWKASGDSTVDFNPNGASERSISGGSGEIPGLQLLAIRGKIGGVVSGDGVVPNEILTGKASIIENMLYRFSPDRSSSELYVSWRSGFPALHRNDALVTVGYFSGGHYTEGGALAGTDFLYGLAKMTTTLPTTAGIATYDAIFQAKTRDISVTGMDIRVPIWRGKLAVGWSMAPTVKIGIDLRGDADGLATPGLVANLAGSEVSLTPGTGAFAGTAYFGQIPLMDGTRVRVLGFFAGNSAERAIVSFEVGQFSNIVVFSSVLPSSSSAGSFTAPLDMSAPPLAMVYSGSNGTLIDQSANITALTQDGTTGVVTSYTKTGIDTVVINTAQGVDVGGDALITWGRWVNGTPQFLGTGGGPMNQTAIGAEQGFHYVIGKLSPSLPASGSANFTLLGATKPTFTDGSASFPAGTLASTGAIPMAVEWGGTAFTRIGLDMTVTMPNDGTYRIQTPGGVANPADGANTLSTAGDARFSGFNIPVTITGGGRACNGGTCEATVKGFFSGANGVRAGLNYSVSPAVGPPGPPGVIGAAAFVKQ